MFLHRKQKVNAVEFPKGIKWVNGEPVSLKSLRGKVVLLDFWTYSCMNCLNTIDATKLWHKRYANKGLVIIGVHTPEFEFEKNEANLNNAIKKLKIPYAIIADNDYKVWSAYENRWWPRKLLINKDGEIVYDHVGEGGYAQFETQIQECLREIGQSDFPNIVPDPLIGGAVHQRITTEIYFGFLHGKLGNPAGYSPAVEYCFEDAKEHADDLIYLHGHWVMEKERTVHARALAHANEYTAIKYSGFSVNLIAGAIKQRRIAEIEVELDGHALPHDMAGEDVVFEHGKAIVQITAPRMYNIVNSAIYHKGTLKLKTSSDNLELYAFTFGVHTSKV